MKIMFAAAMGFLCAFAQAESVILKDGTRLEAEITGEMNDVILVKTRYGPLTINKSDILEIAVSSTAAAVPPDTATAAPERSLTFKTVSLSTSATSKIYYADEVAVATETYDAGGKLLSLDGNIPDGLYRELFSGGKIKSERPISSSKVSGLVKAFFESGALQSSAMYSAGELNGQVKIFSETGTPLFEQNFLNGVPNGWFREYDSAGALRSETYYSNGQPGTPPAAAGEKKPEEKAEESAVTAKYQSLARGERFSFYVNGKYFGKVHLDRDLNILSQEGNIPDGAVRVYTKDGKLSKEFFFEKNVLKRLRVYEEGGPLKAEYTFVENRSVKK